MKIAVYLKQVKSARMQGSDGEAGVKAVNMEGIIYCSWRATWDFFLIITLPSTGDLDLEKREILILKEGSVVNP